MNLDNIVKKIRNSELDEGDVLKYGRILIKEFAKEHHKEKLILNGVSRSKTLETNLINKRDKLKKERLQIQNLINNNSSMSYDYIFDKTRMIPFLNSQIVLLNGLIND